MAISVLLAAFLAAPALASTLSVLTANPRSGSHHARVGVTSSCTAELHEVVSGAIGAGTYEACTSLTSDGDLGAGSTTFRAGDRVILRDGFSVASGASLTIEIDRALYPDAWVQDDTPDGETVYSANFYVDPSALELTAADRFYHLLAFDGDGHPEVRLGVKYNDGLGEKRLFLEVFEDDGGIVSTEVLLSELVLADA